MSHQFEHYMTYSGQNDQQNSTAVFNAMDTDRPSMQHESSISMEEDINIDGAVQSVSHSNVCACMCASARIKKFEILMVGLVDEIRWLCIFNKQNIRM